MNINFLILAISLCLLSRFTYSYELMVIQGISKEKQTFVTRGGKDKNIFEGKNMTFTSDDVSLIAKAINVTREFTQWELKNNYTDVPFRKGEIVTVNPTTEHLWALSPAKIRRRYINNEIFKPRNAVEAQMSLSRALSESVSEAPSEDVTRGGYQFESAFRGQLSRTWAYSVGLRFSRDVISTPISSLVNQRFMGTAEARYQFDPMRDFYNGRIGLALGIGFGQSRTVAAGQTSFGDVLMLPGTKLSLDIPLSKKYEFGAFIAFESLRLEENFADSSDQTTNFTNSKVGFLMRMNLDQI